jgi:HK97 family phage portal protein
MELKFSIKRNRKGSEHVQKSGITSEVLAKLQDYLQYNTSDFGDTKRFVCSYDSNPLVFIVANKVASNAAALPKKVVNKEGEEISNSKIEEVLKNPNEDQNRGEFEQQVNEFVLLAGNSFIRVIPGIGAGITLKVLESQNVTILIDKFGEVVGYKYVNNMGKIEDIPKEEVIHIRMSSSLKTDRESKYWGLSPLSPMWKVVSASDDLFTARSVLWKNRGKIGIVTNKSEVPMLPKERKRVQAEFDKDTGGAHNANGVHVSPNNLDFIKTGASVGDLKLLEGNTDNMRVISAGYKMPSVLFNDTDNSTYNNLQEAKKDAYLDAYIPLSERVNNKLSEELSKILKVEERIVVDITRIEVLKSTTNEVANRLNNLPTNVAARVMETLTLDEAREIVGLDSTADGDKLLGSSSSNSKTIEDETK